MHYVYNTTIQRAHSSTGSLSIDCRGECAHSEECDVVGRGGKGNSCVYKQRKHTKRRNNRWSKSQYITLRRMNLVNFVMFWNDLFSNHGNWFWEFFGIQALITLFFVTCVSQGYLFFHREGMVWCESFKLTHLCSCIILTNMGINFFLILISVLTFRR